MNHGHIRNRTLLQSLMRYQRLEIAVSSINEGIVFFRVHNPEQSEHPVWLTVGLSTDFEAGVLPPIGPVIIKRSGKVISYGNTDSPRQTTY